MLPKNQAEFLKICTLQAYFRAKPRPDPALFTNIKQIYDRHIFIGAKYNNQKYLSHINWRHNVNLLFPILLSQSETNKNSGFMTDILP